MIEASIEDLAKDRFIAVKSGGHIHILRALPGEKKYNRQMARFHYPVRCLCFQILLKESGCFSRFAADDRQSMLESLAANRGSVRNVCHGVREMRPEEICIPF